MDELLNGYKVQEGTWFYLSFLLIVAVYFRFNRPFSLRNVDLLALLAIAPGILLARHGLQAGYVWLFGVSAVLLLRLVFDGYFTRRPRLEQNLNSHGLMFLCASAYFLLSLTAWNGDRLPDSTVKTAEAAERLLNRQDDPKHQADHPPPPHEDAKAGPAATVLTAPFVSIPKVVATINPSPERASAPRDYFADGARLASIMAHLAVVIALFCMGRWHFGDQKIGLAMAALYLLLPCTSYEVALVNHALPAALILWAIVAYRRPAVSGALMGLACGTLFFPVFLLPLWISFYDRRGVGRFCAALCVVAAILVGSLALTSNDTVSFRNQTIGAIDWTVLSLRDNQTGGFWHHEIAAYRIPVFVAFCGSAVVLSFWPRHKTLEQLIAHSAAIVVGTQFWYPQQGGVYSLWYLPLVLVVVFRPSLSHLLPPDLSHRESAEQSNASAAPRELVGSGAGMTGAFMTRFR